MSVEPMNPAPPVTTARIGAPSSTIATGPRVPVGAIASSAPEAREPPEHLVEAGGRVVLRLGLGATSGDETGSELRIVDEPGQGGGERRGIARFGQQAGLAVDDQFPDPREG